MAKEFLSLHSHSALEQELKMEKRFVLIDAKFKDIFSDIADEITQLKYRNVIYYKVPILAFVMRGGAFKRLSQ